MKCIQKCKYIVTFKELSFGLQETNVSLKLKKQKQNNCVAE